LEAITKSVADVTSVVSPLPEFWRGYVGTVFDHFVFQIHGDPYPTLPEGTAREVVRRIASKYLVRS
jgi:hypothetical protein